MVQRSLSILLPVKNAQSTLAATVQEILDVVSELSERIELLIIDDGSADATSEVAAELTRHYPQVRAICQGRSLGREAAIRTGLQESTGEVVLIEEENQGKPLDEIVKLWKGSFPEGRFFWRTDAGKRADEIKSIRPYSLADSQLFKCPAQRQPQFFSRPVRPNFLVRSRQNPWDE